MTKNDISNEGRYTIIDVAKAIGIISVMFGHACTELPITHLRIARFVYFYHLMIFFFVAGFCFNEEKTMQNPSKPIGKNSFHFMALHFTAYKIVDLVYSIIISDTLENRLKFVQVIN